MEGANMNRIVRVTLTPVVLLTTTVAVVPLTGHAEDNDSINSRPTVYAEGLRNGWRDWSWDSSVSLWDSSYSHSGNYSASCSYLQPWAGLYFAHNTLNTAGYNSLVF